MGLQSTIFHFFFQSVLRWSVAVSTICRQSPRVVAFLQAVARPKFRGPRSASIARSQVRLVFLLVASSRAVLVGYTLQGLDDGPREVNCEQYGRRAADVYYSHQVREVLLTSAFDRVLQPLHIIITGGCLAAESLVA